MNSPGGIRLKPSDQGSRIVPSRTGNAGAFASAVLLPVALLSLALRLDPDVRFAQWDNFEFFLPGIWFAHQQLLGGAFPHWNPHQFMGEPMHAYAQFGVLYAPYTLCVWLIDRLGAPPEQLMSLITLLHAGMAGGVFYLLARELGARPLFSLVSAISTVLSGFALYLSSVGLYTMPYLAWFGLALWAFRRLVDGETPVLSFALSACSLAAFVHIGHPQYTLYGGIVVGVFAGLYALLKRRFRQRAGLLLAAALVGSLLAMPTVLPMWDRLGDTPRAEPIPRKIFGGRGVTPLALEGLLLPVYRGDDGFLDHERLCIPYVGAWVLPGLLCGVALMIRRGRAARTPLRTTAWPRADADRLRVILLLTGLSSGILWLSLGEHGHLYVLTYGIPLWSRFRWPFKLYQWAFPLLPLGAALSLEWLAQQPFRRVRAIFFLGWAAAALGLWVARPFPVTPSALVAGIAGLLAVATLPWIRWPAARWALLGLTVAGSAVLPSLTHHAGRFKTYKNERFGSFGVEAFHLSPGFRVLSVSPSWPRGSLLQELGLFNSATMNGYDGLTGAKFALTSRSLQTYLPVNPAGLLPRHLLPQMLRSHLLRAFNAKYVIVAKYDAKGRAWMDSLPEYAAVAETPHARVYANRLALPRVYFATAVHPGDRAEVIRGLWENQKPPTTAFVEGVRLSQAVPVGEVRRVGWDPTRIVAEVLAPQGGFLVFSMSFFPDWKARVDGRPATLLRTNGVLAGVALPPGASLVELEFVSRSLERGAALAVGGVLLGILVTAWIRRAERRRSGRGSAGDAPERPV